jgi:hypothetical protein
MTGSSSAPLAAGSAGRQATGRERAQRARLGNTRATDQSQVDALTARQDRRAERNAMRRWLHEHSAYGRTRQCGTTLRTSADPTLRLSGSGADAVMGVAGVVTCGSRTCPVCAAKIGRREAETIADTLRVHRDTVYHPELARYGLQGGAAVLVTLTLRHHLGQALLFLLGVLGYAWRLTMSGGGYAKLAEQFGIVGWIRCLEINRSRVNGWHPHLHVVILLETAMSLQMAEEMGGQLFARWQRGVRRKGADTLHEHGVRVDLCDLGDMSSGALGAYLSKIGHEVAGSVGKQGRTRESFTVIGLLREVIDTYEYQAFNAWRELEDAVAGKRRKFLTWSAYARELRARAGHGREDKSDEELAEEDMGSADLVAVERDDWPRLFGRLDELFRVGERRGMPAAVAWLDAAGIRWRWVKPAPQLPRVVRPVERAPRVPTCGRIRRPSRWRS